MKRKNKKKNAFREIYRDVKIPWGRYILAILFNGIFYLLMALTTSTASQIVAGNVTDMSVVVVWAGLHLFGYVFQLTAIVGTYANIDLVKRVQSKIWHQVLHLRQKDYDTESPNALISRVTSDADIATTPFTLLIALSALVVVFIFGLLSMTNVNDTMVKWYVALFVPVLVYSIYICRFSKKAGMLQTDRLSKQTAYLSERLSNIRLIKASQAEDKEYLEGDALIEERYKAVKYQAFATALTELSANLSLLVAYITALVIGAILLANGTITDSSRVYHFYTYGLIIAQSLMVFMQYPATFAGMSGAADKFTSVLRMEREDTEVGISMPDEIEDLSLKNVTFSYNGNDQILDQVNCLIPKGKVTAIVGANGSGKSTMMKIIDRLYETSDGVLLFGNTNASEISLASWRKRFGMVSQNAALFGGSIRDNICYGMDREVSDDELAEVAAKAKLDELVARVPGGFSFDVGTSGCHLSGGEQQRVAIARAMIKNPDYLILDEATANLDAKTEQEVQESLQNLMRGRTTIMITHNRSMIQYADHVIRIDEGRVVSEGKIG